jgi:uncharacterized protein YjiS (DUF1127 family)
MKFIIDALNTLFNNVAKNRTAKELLEMTDSRLKDLGLSRFKLEQGAASYPWKVDTNAVVLNFSVVKASKAASIVNPQPTQTDKVAA